MADNTKRILRLHTLIARVMADQRFDDGRRFGHELRGLVIAYHWAQFEGGDKNTVWDRTLTLAGLKRAWDSTGRHRLRELYRSDCPRFEPGSRDGLWRTPCPAPMLRGPRAGEPCGRSVSLSGRVTDIDTGEWEYIGWCSRHRDQGVKVLRAQRAVKPKRRPFPNVGGLLPCHIAATNWPAIYKAADSQWEPPEVGICADDWPVMEKVVRHAQDSRMRFEAIDGDQQDADLPRPALRLVTT